MSPPWFRALAPLAAGLALAACAAGPASSGAQVEQVQLVAGRYEPTTLTVPVGTEVRWHNVDSDAHTVTLLEAQPSGREEWDSGPIGPGSTFSHTFEVAGEYLYGCQLHPEEQMVGTIRVEEP